MPLALAEAGRNIKSAAGDSICIPGYEFLRGGVAEMKRFFVFFLFLLFASTGFAEKARILMLIAPGNFRDEELLVPKREFENAGYKVVVVSKEKKLYRGMLGAEVMPDLALRDVNIDDYIAFVLVGGSGSVVYFEDPEVRDFALRAYKSGKVTSAICLAPVILANAGLLDGRDATAWQGVRADLKKKGANVKNKEVVRDGTLVTGSGPQAAKEFARQIIDEIEKAGNNAR